MSYIVKRAKLYKGEKFFGILQDRIVVGTSAYRENFTPLDANDPRKDVKIQTTAPKLNSYYSKAAAGDATYYERDFYKPMMFDSTAVAGMRYYVDTYNSDTSHTPLGLLHRSPTLEIDNSGSAGDLLAEGDILFLSNYGVLHRINQTTGEIEVVRYDSSKGSASKNNIWTSGTAASTGTDDTNGWSGAGICINHPYRGGNQEMMNGPWGTTDLTNHSAIFVNDPLVPSEQNWLLVDCSIIAQDDTYIYCSVMKGTKTTTGSYPFGQLTSWAGNSDTSYAASLPIRAIITIRKSDGLTEKDLNGLATWPDALWASTGSMVGFDSNDNMIHFKKGVYNSSNGQLSISKHPGGGSAVELVHDKNLYTTTPNSVITQSSRWTGPTRFLDSRSDPGTASKIYWPESVDYDHPDPSYPNTHCPVIMMSKWNAAGDTVINQSTQCALTNLPAEYQGEQGANTLKCLLKHSAYDRYECFEIEDGGEQYIVFWSGVTRSEEAATDVDTYSNSDDATAEFYRYMVVFKVSATDDTELEYVSDVGDFKYKKPMWGMVATDDNKTIVFADRNGLHPARWNGPAEAFAALDPILLPKVWSMGMSPGTSTDYATCWIETIEPIDDSKPNTYHEGPSDVYQLQIGDYKDVDFKYIDSSLVEHLEFSTNLLDTEKDVNGDYIAKTFDVLIRVKSQTGSTQLDFDTGNSIAVKVSGGNMETDGLSIDGYDSGNPYLKTITSGADWVTVTINYKLPLTRITLSASIV